MHKFLPALLGCGSAVLMNLPLPAKAQEYQGCFMVNGQGRVLDLSALCSGDAAAVPVYASRSGQAFTMTTDEEQDLEASYAETYCHARRDGASHVLADSLGMDGLKNMMKERYSDPDQSKQAWDAIVNHTFARHTVERAQGLCPTLYGNDNDPNARPASSDSNGNCEYPTDRASDGSLCGDRAASRRYGGQY